MLGHTPLLKLKPSSHHLAGNNLITPSYNPDLVPSDFHLFLCFNKFLAGRHFLNDDDIEEAVKKWLSSQAATFYEERIQKLVPRYNKCVNNGGNCAEK
jgi:histone-lysine N-methyltransferase SETMAR